jgi:hypothetical protein
MSRSPEDLEAERRRAIEEGRSTGTCPACGTTLEPGSGVGSGSLKDGLFCSISCYATFNAETLRLRTDRLGEDG